MYRHLFLRGVSSVAIAVVLAGSLPHSLQAKVVSQSSPTTVQEAKDPCHQKRSEVSRIEGEIGSKKEELSGLEVQLKVALSLISRLETRIRSDDLTPEVLAALQEFVLELEDLVRLLREQIQNLVDSLRELDDQLLFANLQLFACLAKNSGPTPGVQDNFAPSYPQSSQQEFDFDGASSAASPEVFHTINQVLKQAQAILGSQ